MEGWVAIAIAIAIDDKKEGESDPREHRRPSPFLGLWSLSKCRAAGLGPLVAWEIVYSLILLD